MMDYSLQNPQAPNCWNINIYWGNCKKTRFSSALDRYIFRVEEKYYVKFCHTVYTEQKTGP